MKVILRKDSATLGQAGAVVTVKDGYARNYLIPRGIAYEATDGGVRQLEEERKQLAKRIDKEHKQAENIAVQLEKISITLKMKVGEEDKLFGSVTSQMIADALVEKEIQIDKRHIELDEPIKALGIYDVPIKLAEGVGGKIKVWVVRE
jgi:large subunit ribosomal protein L9